MPDTELKRLYGNTKRLCAREPVSPEAGRSILELATRSLEFLIGACRRVDLVSRVPTKQYFSFARGNVVARPANTAYFIASPDTLHNLWLKWLDGTITEAEFASLTYTVALAPCLAMELFDRQNKKGPATYFECFVGHLFARSIGVNPTRRAHLLVAGRTVRMTMDFLFEIGGGHPKVHLPVKMSTRERVVQAWAHQRLLDSAYGVGAYRGIMVLFSETKLASRTLEVVEICVPDQWLAYQTLLAKMDRIYYFDLPVRYEQLSAENPYIISIKQFGEFFTEKEEVLHS